MSSSVLLQVVFYEGLKDLTEYGKQNYIRDPKFRINSSVEGLILGGLAGGMCLAYTLSYYLVQVEVIISCGIICTWH